MKMHERPEDIQKAWRKLVDKSKQEEFTEEERQRGYAEYMASWWHSTPDDATNEMCRDWYGIPQLTEKQKQDPMSWKIAVTLALFSLATAVLLIATCISAH